MADKVIPEKLRAAIRAACPDIPETNEGMFWLGNRCVRFVEPTDEEKARRIAGKIVEVPTYSFTFTIDPNKTVEG